MLELKYEHFIATWPGRIKCVELFLALFCFMCGAPGYEGPQHWFLLVAALAFLGTIFFSLYYLCLAEPLNKLGVNWLMGEFWFTAGATFAYFTAFVAMLVNFSDRVDDDWQYWIDANIAAGLKAVGGSFPHGGSAPGSDLSTFSRPYSDFPAVEFEIRRF